MDFIRLYIYFIAFSFFASLILYIHPRPRQLYLKLFPPYLLSTLVVEVWGAYTSSINSHNNEVYNYFTTLEFCFYLFALHSIIINKKARRIIVITLVAYAIVAVINIMFYVKPAMFHMTTYSIGCLIIALFCMYYFFELFRLPKSVDLKINPAFWLCAGLLFFYTMSFTLYAFIYEWAKIELMRKSFRNILDLLNMFLYSLFTIAFICTKTRKYTLSPSSA